MFQTVIANFRKSNEKLVSKALLVPPTDNIILKVRRIILTNRIAVAGACPSLS